MTIRIHNLQKETKVHKTYNQIHNDKKRKNPNNITILQRFAALHHTSPNYTSLHLSTLHSFTFTLHYPLICLNPFTFPTALIHLPSLNYTQYNSPISKLISKITNLLTALTNLSLFHRISHHFTEPLTISQNLSPPLSSYVRNDWIDEPSKHKITT